MSYKGFENKIEFIKNKFQRYFVDVGPEQGVLQGMKYAGASTHTNNCLFTLAKMLEPVYVLEIGSLHYETSGAIAMAMDIMRGKSGAGQIDSFDIKFGGYDGNTNVKPISERIRPGYWYPFPTNYDDWKYHDPMIAFPSFKTMTPAQIRKQNEKILAKRTKKFGAYDLIFIDGDHSYDGAKEDWDIALKFSTKETVIVIDNVWDERLKEVRRFYNDLEVAKWDFEEWNDEHYRFNMVMDNAVLLTY